MKSRLIWERSIHLRHGLHYSAHGSFKNLLRLFLFAMYIFLFENQPPSMINQQHTACEPNNRLVKRGTSLECVF